MCCFLGSFPHVFLEVGNSDLSHPSALGSRDAPPSSGSRLLSLMGNFLLPRWLFLCLESCSSKPATLSLAGSNLYYLAVLTENAGQAGMTPAQCWMYLLSGHIRWDWVPRWALSALSSAVFQRPVHLPSMRPPFSRSLPNSLCLPTPLPPHCR